jgi:hypothetical protein
MMLHRLEVAAKKRGKQRLAIRQKIKAINANGMVQDP